MIYFLELGNLSIWKSCVLKSTFFGNLLSWGFLVDSCLLLFLMALNNVFLPDDSCQWLMWVPSQKLPLSPCLFFRHYCLICDTTDSSLPPSPSPSPLPPPPPSKGWRSANLITFTSQLQQPCQDLRAEVFHACKASEICEQGCHWPGKPGKVREFETNPWKSRNLPKTSRNLRQNSKSQGKV